jgi:hypothetical protein
VDDSFGRNFVADPDSETVESVETVAQQFKRTNPAYIPTTRNYETIATTLAFNALSASQRSGTLDEIVADLIVGGFWTVRNLTACFHALTKEGLLDMPAGTARNLTERERLHVTRLAQVGRAEDAVSQYLQYALDGEEPSTEILHDTAYRQCRDEAVFTVFEAHQADYAPTPERDRYLLRYAAGRPLTLTLLTQAWRACQQNKQRHERGELLNSRTHAMGLKPQSRDPHPISVRTFLWNHLADQLLGTLSS